ncbi:PAS domain-containing protein [Arenibacter amylolyticus]|uniref:PAS domain-containing protein n=1 Tax=Arenibacter amylolyticus TaxID=1406873 RepID=UPI000A3719B5|nr:PAS domain S-box protein [Arenibacter amylolyticus]
MWETKEMAVWDSIEEEKAFKRGVSSDEHCPQEVIGIPLMYNNEVKGVLVLGNENGSYNPSFYGKLFQQLKATLGEEIKRKNLELELDQIFKYTPDIICEIGDDGYFKKINPAATKLLGFSEQEFLSENLLEFIHPEDREETSEYLSRLYQGEPLRYFENRYLTKEGKTKWLSWTADLTHETGITYAVAKDITEKQEIKELLKEVTDLALIGAWEVDFEKGTVFWSEMTKKIHGVAKDFVPNFKNIQSFYEYHEGTNKFLEVTQSVFHEGMTIDLEMPIRTAKGKEKWVRLLGKSEFVKDQCVRIYGSFQDIHELKTSQLDYKRTTEEKNAILESIGDAFISLTNEGIVTYWNSQAEDSFGMDREATLGHHIKEVFPHIRYYKIYEKINEGIKNNKKFTLEKYFPRFNTWYEINAYPSDNGISIYVKDVSERVKADNEIRLTNERFEKVAQAANDVLWDCDISKNTIFFSESFKLLFGHEISADTEILQLWKSLVHPLDKKRVLRSYYKEIQNPKSSVWECEYRLLKATGEYAYVWDKATVIRDADGKATRMIGAITDITMRKTYEDSLKQLNNELQERALNIEAQNKKLRDIAWTQSHVVRAPLARTAC